MIFRFSLYGFLKNQRYYELFIVLAFLEKGLSFTMIGMLIGFGGLCTALLEIPTGAVADVVGRRRSMILSFLAYIASFILLGLTRDVPLLFAAMGLFGVGEAFRTGTHKAMIFDWLAHQGREDEKVKVYGFTRSWSKIGSAVSAVIAAALVFVTGRYSTIFLFSIAPYVANIVNFLTYPAYLDGPRAASANIRGVFGLLVRTLGRSVRIRSLRKLFAESMAFGGAFKVSHDYIQPVIKAAALAAPIMLAYSDLQRTAVLVGAVGIVLFSLESAASRHADTLARRAGSPDAGARWLWWMNLACFAAIAGSLLLGPVALVATIAGFVALAVLQNFWRPIQVSRFMAHADPSQAATVLSIESQSKSLFAAAAAPLLGLAVDTMPDRYKFLPVGALGLLVAVVVIAWRSRTSRDR